MAESSEEQKRIVEILTKKGVKLPCPRCGNNHFVVQEGFLNPPLAEKVGDIILGGKTIPTIVTFCSNCGFLSQHVAGVLQLLPKPEAKAVKDD